MYGFASLTGGHKRGRNAGSERFRFCGVPIAHEFFRRAFACANGYPNRPIHFIVGFAAAGGNDLFADLVVQKFQENTGSTVVIENRVGAGGRLPQNSPRASRLTVQVL